MVLLTDGNKLSDIIPHTKKIKVVGTTGKKSVCAITNSVEVGTIITAHIGFSSYNYENSILLHWEISDDKFNDLLKNHFHFRSMKDRTIRCHDARVFKRLDNVFIFEEVKDE